MAKAKKSSVSKRHLHPVLTTPNTMSRVLTWILLLGVPFIAFFLGMRYQEAKDRLAMFELQDQMIMQQSATPEAEMMEK
jgi:hypothetical protein